jgi:hypothetical protein
MLASGALNLLLAILWLVAGVAILLADPPNLRFPRGAGGISLGWAALLLALYNTARWWGLRSAWARRRAAEELERRREPRRPPAAPEAERNPDFIFDEPPPDKPT